MKLRLFLIVYLFWAEFMMATVSMFSNVHFLLPLSNVGLMFALTLTYEIYEKEAEKNSYFIRNAKHI